MLICLCSRMCQIKAIMSSLNEFAALRRFAAVDLVDRGVTMC